MDGGDFASLLMREIYRRGTDVFTYPLDPYRFPNASRKNIKRRRWVWLLSILPYSLFNFLVRRPFMAKRLLGKYHNLIPALGGFYSLLGDNASKMLLVNLLLYRILGPRYVKLPLNTEDYWADIRKLETTCLAQANERIRVGLDTLDLVFLQFKEQPISLFYTPYGVYHTFTLEHYRHPLAAGISPGDTVLDLGGCYGDTAIYSSIAAGSSGRVFVFEFIPANLRILRMNLELNSILTKNVTVVERPVWESSGLSLPFIDRGAGSKVSEGGFHSSDGMAVTISVDDFVEQFQVDQVDFIKMDIEGAEPFALRGALRTIKAFRPRLAISIYHSPSDFANIVHQINSWGLGYEFHIGHCSTHAEETVLFALVNRELDKHG